MKSKTLYSLSASALLVAGITAAAYPAAGGTVLQTDFESLTNGTVTATNLNGVTTGGSWNLVTNRGATYAIQEDSETNLGDKALLLDDPDSSNNGGVQKFVDLTLDTAVDLSAETVTWDFKTATRRTGANKGLRFEFLSNGGAEVAATIDWSEGGGLSLNAGEDTGTSAFDFLFNWGQAVNQFAVRDVSVLFDGSAVTVNFGDQTLTGTVQNSATSIGEMRIYSIGSSVQLKGLFLDDVTATTALVPEPSSLALLGLATLCLSRRRRMA